MRYITVTNEAEQIIRQLMVWLKTSPRSPNVEVVPGLHEQLLRSERDEVMKIKEYAYKRFDDGATVEQVATEVAEKFPHQAGGLGYVADLKRKHATKPATIHKVSALYCPDGRRYEWTAADARGAELLARMLAERAREVGGEWVDVETAQS